MHANRPNSPFNSAAHRKERSYVRTQVEIYVLDDVLPKKSDKMISMGLFLGLFYVVQAMLGEYHTNVLIVAIGVSSFLQEVNLVS